MDVELRHLRAFAAVAHHRSFTRAAEELLITQPALSRTVTQLESALSVRLLDRSSRHVELTGTGREFLTRVEHVLAALDQALAAARREITIRLGFSWLLPDPWAQDAVNQFTRTTGASVALVRRDDPIRGLQQGTIDIALVRGEFTAPRSARAVHLYDEPRIAVCSQNCDLARSDHLDWADVPRRPLVVNTVSGTTGPWSWPAGQGPEQIVETTNFDEWLESVAADRGIGVIPEIARRRISHSAIRYIPLTGAPPSPVSLVYLPHAQQALIRGFLEAAVAAVNG
ncbi:LysR family transcriptional regulator [Streptomyces sp. NPDC004096]|uniref:LysR family transcriptional regulator n=1 Tax=Streptomyces sp. NPDC004675 TaxID=3154286 RepID=UPI0033A335D2